MNAQKLRKFTDAAMDIHKIYEILELIICQPINRECEWTGYE